jgi:hypothetical protein
MRSWGRVAWQQETLQVVTVVLGGPVDPEGKPVKIAGKAAN